MGRRPHSKTLQLWMNGTPVGQWRLDAHGDDLLTYDPSWLGSPQFRPISLSLPAPAGGGPLRSPAVAAYFDNLLPDSAFMRQRLQDRFHTASTSPFDLLAAIGRDCVGALQLTPEGEAPANVEAVEVEPLDDDGVERELRRAAAPRAAAAAGADDEDDEPLRISLAGAQEKTALTWHDGQWCRPRNATPTTHIFKLPLGLVGNRQADMSTSVENEWLCSELLRAFGVPVAHCEIRRFGVQKVLVVERFDRRLHSSHRFWVRLPQEDFCQATGTPSARKYQAEGGPGIFELARILERSEARDADLRTLLSAQLLFWMLAAPDGHAKNFSIYLLPGGRYRLTPLYDVLSAWPMVGDGASHYAYQKLKLALALRARNVHYRMGEIHRRHFVETARRCGLGSEFDAVIDDIVARAPSVVAYVGARLPPGFPARVFDTITQGLLSSAARL